LPDGFPLFFGLLCSVIGMNACVNLFPAIFTSIDDPRAAGYNFHFTAAGLTGCPGEAHKYA
jgi:hypothetical protein